VHSGDESGCHRGYKPLLHARRSGDLPSYGVSAQKIPILKELPAMPKFNRILLTAIVISLLFCVANTSYAQTDSGKARDYFDKASRLLKDADYTLAEEMLLKSLEYDSSFAPSLIELGFVDFKLNRFADAERNLNKAIKINNQYDRAWYILSMIKFRMNDLKGSKENIEKAIKINSNESTYFFLYGSILSKQENFKGAIDMFDKSLELNPLNQAAKANKALCLLNMGNTVEASDNIEAALKSDPRNFQVILIKGIILARTGNPDAAYEYFVSASRISKDEPLPYYNMALIDMKRKNRGQAEFNLLRSVDLDRYDPAPCIAICRLYRDEKRTEDALRWLRKASTLDPDNTSINIELGVMLLAMEKNGEAASILEKAVLTSPDNAQARNALGAVYRSMGKYKEALEEYNRAIALDPNLTAVYFNLANLFEDRGMIQETLENLKKYLENTPGAEDSEQIAKRIKLLEETLKIKTNTK
jgi:tetratricopeptide (TPR) repeat protein